MRRTALLPVFLLVWSGMALADAGDPPARVARLNYLSGSVSFRPGDVDEWTAATLNYPLTTGDHLWADEDGGVEMHIGANAVRLAARTAVEFLNLDDHVAQLSLPQGGVQVRLISLDSDQTFEIDTPNGAVLLRQPGVYRIDVNPDDNSTYVTVRNGEAEVDGAGNPFALHAGELARVGGDPVASEVNAARPPDGWEQWCMDRDVREDQAAQASANYVPREMVGAEDLGSYGDWRPMPEYGTVWVPRVQAGWAPYHNGHWAWVAPWGWTWIDEAPWGFAPFHYGRWAFVAGTWVWVPGARVARPVYAPALVVFVGGPRATFAGGAGVAWFPLGPREAYVPTYRVSETYVRQVNVTHATNISVTNVRYVNQSVPGAVTAVPQRAFATARPVRESAVAVSPQEISRAEVVHSAPAAPSREAMLGRTPSGDVAQPPARLQNRPVVAKTPPAASVTTRVRTVQSVRGVPRPAPRSVPANVDRPAAVSRPTPDGERPAAAERPARPEVRSEPRQERSAPVSRPTPNVERPAAAERPARPEVRSEPTQERPAPVSRPTPNVERPAAAERPARQEVRSEPRPERPAAAERPARPEVRSEPRQERHTEEKPAPEERHPQKKSSQKEEKKRDQ